MYLWILYDPFKTIYVNFIFFLDGLIYFSSWVMSKQFYNLQFKVFFLWNTFLCFFYLDGCCLLNSYMFLLLILKILSWFFHLNFFHYTNNFLFFFQTVLSFYNIFINIICFLSIQGNCLHTHNTIWLFVHMLVASNHTKTHSLLFYWFLILIDLNKLA